MDTSTYNVVWQGEYNPEPFYARASRNMRHGTVLAGVVTCVSHLSIPKGIKTNEMNL